MRITKLLSLDSAPAQSIVDRAKSIALTMAERVKLPETFTAAGETVENALGEVRPLEVGDILVDEKGGFYKIEAAPEDILKVTGEASLMQEAVYAFSARGLRVAPTEDGFAVVAIEQLRQLLENVGLSVTEAHEPFIPVPLPRHGGCGCGCGGNGHHHGHGEGCGCGGHHHHHDEDGCCCGGSHHHEEGECGCGGHHHHHDEGECCCGGGHHHEEGECGCGGHHHHDEGECCCGGGHHHEDGECGCGGHHHHHDEGECCCGSGHHHEDGECGCGGHHHHGEGECGGGKKEG